MGEERLPHLHSQVVRRVDEDIKIISNKIGQSKQIFSLSYPPFLFSYMRFATLPRCNQGFQGPGMLFHRGTNDFDYSLSLLMWRPLVHPLSCVWTTVKDNSPDCLLLWRVF